MLTFTVPEGNDRKVYYILRGELHISAAGVRRLKLKNGIFVNGEPVFTDKIIHPGDVLTADIDISEPESDIVPQDGPLDILYETSHYLLVNKPKGLLVHPSRSKYTGTLSNYVAGYLLKNNPNAHVHAVNRLDRDTSGVVLFAKSSYAKNALIQSLKGNESEKIYTALVYGFPEPKKGTVNAPIMRYEEGNMLRIVSPEGQNAVTHYELISSGVIEGFEVSLLQIKLETGRTHQIRVHMKHIGHPVLGDKLYNNEESAAVSAKLGINEQALHAKSLIFRDPFNNQTVCVTAENIATDAIFEKILLKKNS